MYDYQAQRAALFTDEGQRRFLAVRDRVARLLALAGAVRMQEATAKTGGESWEALACMDRMVELGEIREITGPDVAGQHRVFVAAR